MSEATTDPAPRSVRKVEYRSATVEDRPGAAGEVLDRLARHGVYLTAFLAFPRPDGTAQLDLVPEEPFALDAAARETGIALSDRRTAILVSGPGRMGTLHEHMGRLARARINCTAATAVALESGGYGFLIGVAPQDVEAAVAALRA